MPSANMPALPSSLGSANMPILPLYFGLSRSWQLVIAPPTFSGL